ncbi:MAG: DegV family protein [Oscillospiraceae bacterium]|nr:DegV family protein [Oscillospiraceae bacterium]
MLRIITDSGADITNLDAGALGLDVAEIGISFEEFPYDQQADTDFSVFYENLTRSKKLPTTSQVTPGQYLDLFEDARAKGDEVLVITISGALSGTYQSAEMAKEMSGYEAISLVDSRQCCLSQRMLVEHALKLRDAGQDRAAIVTALEELREQMVLVVVLDTLKYLKKGGRVPPAMAFLGEVLGMKPVVTVRDGKVEPLTKARGLDAGKRALWAQFEKDGYDTDFPVVFGYSQNAERGEAFMQETKEKYGIADCTLHPVGGVIGSHGGPGGIAIGYRKK